MMSFEMKIFKNVIMKFLRKLLLKINNEQVRLI